MTGRPALRPAQGGLRRSKTGLINASYPLAARPLFSTYKNVQAEAPWTGIEYAMASMMYEFGMVAEAAAVVRAVHERYMRAGRFWNHVECGDHYYRAMSSWAVLLSATGFKLDLPRKRVTFAPAVGSVEFRAPWFAYTAWGVFVQSHRRFELHCRSGSLSFQELHVRAAGAEGSAVLNGQKLPAVVIRRDGVMVLRFHSEITLGEGQTLVVT